MSLMRPLFEEELMEEVQPVISGPTGGSSNREPFHLVCPQVLYEDSRMVTLTAPYIPGFLAFRETPFLLDALKRLHSDKPELLPQVQFIKKYLPLPHFLSRSSATTRL